MWAGNSTEALLGAMDRLCAELPDTGSGEIAASPPLGDKRLMAGILSAHDELVVRRLKRSLTKIAVALGGYDPGSAQARIVPAVLDGTEMVMRGEVLKGNGERLPKLMPDFVFLVALPIVDQDRAIDLSRRASELIEEALGD